MNINNIAYPSPSRLSVEDVTARIQSLVARSLRQLVQSASLCAAVLLFNGLAIPEAIAETGTLYGEAADAQLSQISGTNSVSGQTTAYLNVGAYYNLTQMCVDYMFQIPSTVISTPTQRFATATFSVKRGAASPTGYEPVFNGDLYGVGYGTTATVDPADFYAGALDTNANNVLIQDSLLTPATPLNTTVSSTGSGLVNYLNDTLTAARANGDSTAHVFFRINSDVVLNRGSYYIMGMNEAGGTNRPSLAYTTEASSYWAAVPLGGGGWVTGLMSDPTGTDIYCRTDVGGAFKWDDAAGQWNCITDLIVSSTNATAGEFMGISSMAMDPNNSNNLYIGVGNKGNTTIYGSNNKGATWAPIWATIAMKEDGSFRPCGERLAVDPNNSNILWYGTAAIGLQKGVLSSGTWSWTQIPSTSVPFGAVPSGDKAGVNFVACDKNGTNTIVYAGVYDSVGTTGGVYMSADGGTNWSKAGGVSIPKPARAQVAPDGTLYVTSGTVAKMLRGGTLQAITPEAGLNYRGLAIDPSDATGNTVYVADTTVKIFRSVDGGATWARQYKNHNNLNYARMEPDGTPCVTGYWFGNVSSLMVNPVNPNELWAADWFGVARTQDVQNMGTTNGSFWYMLQKNQEETCVEALLNAPTGPRLMVGQGDVGGYRYLDTTVRPAGTDGNSFSNPSGGSNSGLDFCESNTNVWARTWLNPDQSAGSGAVSSDGGATWLKFGEINEKVITNSATAGWETWDVGTYLAKQKAKGNNTVTLVICCGNSINPLWANHQVIFDSKEASDYTLRPKVVINGTSNLTPTADTYVANSGTSTNFGNATTLAFSYKSGDTTNSRWIYLKFDLTSVGAIASGTLQLHRMTSVNSTQFPVGVYACANTSWGETTITWGNKPATLASNGDPIANPRYYDGGTLLCGGRIAISSTNPDIMVWLPIYTTTSPRYSDDRGVSWKVCAGAPNSQMISRDNPSNLINQLAADRVNGKFYLAKLSGTNGGHTIYTSTNGGANWALSGTAATVSWNIYRTQIEAAPAANDIWIADDGSINNPPSGGLWRSINGGVNWTKIGNGVIKQVSLVSFGKSLSGTGYTVFINGYKNGIKGIYRSDDYGANWTPLGAIPTDALIQVLAGDRQNYGKVFFGTNGRGVYQGQ